ncbi:5-methyltetrahydrofolate--homocysteine methyltransferase [Brachyspira hampsonii 30446]|uniref:Methionine synthase n=1 Tax=Brachyspira hampsonii 30446 TaxID=1289135 RepID=A0A2U4FAI0_9SPIR|nr:homocysteine S-methyltransferase family protein [Brachyspira hampsonii]EKV56324.1 5-methyltetrahydrofolate--homocysteine methyltransferase [Brachyspira hampsonii 30446]MBW5394934.1 methionine synthase [Brachyspira hampsonii]OEJ20734.1 methionine synthase [Brachyspira hampsonii]
MNNIKEKLSELIKERYLIIDGATGTELQKKDIKKEDWIINGNNVEGCNEILNITAPYIMKEIHTDYLNANANIIKTNSFGAIPWVLSEYDIADKTYELAKKAALIANEAREEYLKNPNSKGDLNRDIFIAGSLGPGVKLPSLGQITFDEMYNGYIEAARGLIEGGADIILLETAQDVLQLKSAIIAVNDTAEKLNKEIPIMVSVTIEKEGTMLLGTDIETAYTILSNLDIFSIGMNCGTGPDMASRHIKKLSEISCLPISIHTNAGLPENRDGKAYYSMTPEEFADINSKFFELDGLSFIGGCCGTTPLHIEELAKKVKGVKPKKTALEKPIPYIASLFNTVSIKQNPAPLMIGERSNATGSKIFRELMIAGDMDGMLDVGIKQVKAGSHAIDVNAAWAGRDEVEDITKIISSYVKQISLPLVIDAIKPNVIEAALKVYGGKPIINSANMEQGEEKFDAICSLAKKYGASIMLLTIDEKSMAFTCEDKLKMAERMYERAVNVHKILPHDIIFDPLTFTLASGDEKSFLAGVETLNAIKELSKKYPECSISLGVSNISFGLKEDARKIMNSVFLYEAINHGLTTAIVNVAQILPLSKIDEKEIELARELIYNKSNSKEPLINYINHFSDKKEKKELNTEENIKKPIREAIRDAMLDGEWKDMQVLLNEVKENSEEFGGEKLFAQAIIDEILLPTMADIGVKFGEGTIQLPFVLGSAEVMKKSVDFLSEFLEKKKQEKTAKIILGTVAGDVHDVGKNLVEIIIKNNGFETVNIGTKVSIEKFLEAYHEHNADCIGMSGLLVKSTEVMKDNLAYIRDKGLKIPILLGGAALTKDFVENICKKVYGDTAKIFYCKDGFDDILAIKEIIADRDKEK